MRAIAFWVCFGLAASTEAAAQESFSTTTFGNEPLCEHKGTLAFDGKILRFDLSAWPAGAKPLRAVLRVSDEGHGTGVTIKVVPVDFSPAKSLEPGPPDNGRFDILPVVQAWIAKPSSNKGLRVEAAGGVNFATAVLEVSFSGSAAKPLPAVSRLQAVHRSGQTFLTWKEPEDIVKKDEPTFEELEKILLDAWTQRQVVYRVYAHKEPITPANLSQAQFLREVPEGLTCWNLVDLDDTEFVNERGKTKTSPLAPGNIVCEQVVPRFRIADKGDPLPRATALAVFTVAEPARRYYAVTVAMGGKEAVTSFKAGENLSAAVDEKPAKSPVVVYQQTVEPEARFADASPVDVFACWLEPPYLPAPGPIEVYRPRWRDLPQGSAEKRLPLYLNLSHHGANANDLYHPIWEKVFRYVDSAVTVGLSAEWHLWSGQHECIGTLRGYDQGVVWNYDERRALLLAGWAVEDKGLFVDPERVYVWGQAARFALRHGDFFAVVMSDGHNNYKTSRGVKSHYWRWGPDGHGKNCFGQDHLDYLDLAKWIRENPAVEIPFWIGAPSYGSFPHHAIGDFGFKPWQEFIAAMKETRRAFSAVWNSNGPGETEGVMREMVPAIKLHQTLPAFAKCPFDSSPDTRNPKGERAAVAHMDQDYTLHADTVGGINLYQRWETGDIVDEPGRWEMTVYLSPDAPADKAAMDLTPRRCQKFKPKPGDRFTWSNTSVGDKKQVQSGDAAADKAGLVTLEKVTVTKGKNRFKIVRK